MIIAHLPGVSIDDAARVHELRCSFERQILDSADQVPENAVWIDLINPTREEDRRAGRARSVRSKCRAGQRALQRHRLSSAQPAF